MTSLHPWSLEDLTSMTPHDTSYCWVAVKELNLSYHSGDIWQIIWFQDYLSSLGATQLFLAIFWCVSGLTFGVAKVCRIVRFRSQPNVYDINPA